jgi:hypothetical protein
MAIKTHEKMLTISSHKGNENKTTLRFHLTLVGIAIIKNITKTGVGEDVRKKEPWYTAGGNASWCNHSGKNLEAFKKSKHRPAV